MTLSTRKRKLYEHIYKKYGRLELTSEQVSAEVLDNSRLVNSSSAIPNSWLINDVVAYILEPEGSHHRKGSSKKEDREKIIEIVNKQLQKYWKSRAGRKAL